MSTFAATYVSDSLVADAAQDYFALEVLVGIVKQVELLESYDNNKLAALLIEMQTAHMRNRELDDPWEYDWEDHQEYYYETGIIEEILHDRAARARYCSPEPLAHRPFATLGVAA